jgi:hypothetical protein
MMDAEGHLRNVIANLSRTEPWDDGLRRAVREAEGFLRDSSSLAETPDDGSPGPGEASSEASRAGGYTRPCIVPGCGLQARMVPSGWVCPSGHGF